MSRFAGTLVVLAMLLMAGSHAGAAGVLGIRPAHLCGKLPAVPNDTAIPSRIGASEIDEGYVRQGVTVADGALLVSSYRSTDPKPGIGPCRVYHSEPAGGRATGWFDMPPSCGRAGGMAYLSQGMLLVADTRKLYKIDLARARGGQGDFVLATLALGGGLKGSLAGFDGKSIFIASPEKDAGRARGFFLLLSLFDTHDGAVLTPANASRILALPALAQGAAFDRDGAPWMTFSNSKVGALKKHDAASGTALASYDMVIGVEDISLDAQGRPWTVSEADSLRWSHAYPVPLSIDPARLR